MTNKEKLYEIAGRLGADADLAVVRAALLALIRVLLGVEVGQRLVRDTPTPREPTETGSLPAMVAEIMRNSSPNAIDDIRRERDAMVARSRRGIQRDDEKTPEDWAASLRKVLDPAGPIGFAVVDLRHMWVKVGAVALRAIESIDRRTTPYEKTRSELAGKDIHMAPIGGWPRQRDDEPQESGK